MTFNSFDSVLYGIDVRIRRILEFLPDDIKAKCEEIRLRTQLPVCLTVSGKPLFVCKDSTVSPVVCENMLIAASDELYHSLLLLCDSSVYAHENEIKNGYISMPHGARAGVCGIFNSDGILNCVTSINIRIAREVYGCADSLVEKFSGGMLIAGPPGSGKTTILRDLVRQLSSGKTGRYLRVAVIDSRGELSGGFNRKSNNYLGHNTDVLFMQNKAAGTQIALRTLFPDVIAFDEIGTAAELESISDCFNAGVEIITTAHSKDISDIRRRSVTSALLKGGAVSRVALLSNTVGAPPAVFSVKEILCDAVY